MNTDQWDHFQQDERYTDDEEDLYDSGADLWSGLGSFQNPNTIPPVSNNIDKNAANPQKTENVKTSTPSTSSRDQIDEKPICQNPTIAAKSTVTPLRWTVEWEAENERNQKELLSASQDVALEVTLPKLELNHNEPAIDRALPEGTPDPTDNSTLTDSQPTFLPASAQPSDINQEPMEEQKSDTRHLKESHCSSQNVVQSNIEIIEIDDDDDEQTEVKQESEQNNSNSSAENGNLLKLVEELKANLAETKKQLKQVQFEKDQLCNNTTSQNVVKSKIEIIEIDDDDDEQTEVEQEPGQVSQGAELEAARSELGQTHNAPAISETSPEAVPYSPQPSLQQTFLPVISQKSDISEEPIEEQEVAPNVDFGHLASTNTHPGVISSAAMDIGSEINTTDPFPETSKEVHDSDVARASMITGQASDKGSTQLPHPNEVRTVVDPNALNEITATATSTAISTEISPLKNAKRTIKQIGSRKSKAPIAPQEPDRNEETPLQLRLRPRKQIHHGDFEDHGLLVKKSEVVFHAQSKSALTRMTGVSNAKSAIMQRPNALISSYMSAFTPAKGLTNVNFANMQQLGDPISSHIFGFIRKRSRSSADLANMQQFIAAISSDIFAFIRSSSLIKHIHRRHNKRALELRANNSKKNAERNLKKSGKKD